MRAKAEDSLAVMIDIQEKLLPVMRNKDIFTKNCMTLIRGLKVQGIPILGARQYPKGLGDYAEPFKTELSDIKPYDKMSFSIMGSTEMRNRISESGKKNIIVFGIETHICVLQSVMDLIAAGYQVCLVADCTSSRKKADHKTALRRAEKEGAFLTTKEAILFELLYEAGGEKFKAISNLVKEN